MSYLNDLLSHIKESYNTLNTGLVGERARGDIANLKQGVERAGTEAMPWLQQGSTPQDIANSGFGAGGAGTLLLKGMPDYSEKLADKALSQLKKGVLLSEVWDRFKMYPWKNTAGKIQMHGEIPDINAKVNLDTGGRVSLMEALDHPAFMRNNAAEGQEFLRTLIKPAQQDSGLFRTTSGQIDVEHTSPESALDILMHELTHAQAAYKPIQKGANQSQFSESTAKLFKTRSQNELYAFKNKLYNKYEEEDPNHQVALQQLIHEYEPNMIDRVYLREKLHRLYDQVRKPAHGLYYKDLGEILARMSGTRSGYSERQLNEVSPLDTIKMGGFSWEDMFGKEK